MSDLILIVLLFAVVLLGRVLLQIRDANRYGIVMQDLDCFIQLMINSKTETVFRKTLFNYRAGRFAYTALIDNQLFTFVSAEDIADRLPSSIRVLVRKVKLE